jgi:hypothetical protein
MNDLILSTDCDGLREENTRLRVERSEFLWTLAWAGDFIAGHMRASAKARRVYGQIDDLLVSSNEGCYV